MPSVELLDKQVDWLQRHVREAMKGQSISTTHLQRLLRPRSQEEYRGSLLEILRPMPQPPARAADNGTLFHRWVESFLDPALSNADVDKVVTSLPKDSDFHNWQKAFLSSRWRSRTAVAVEREYAIALAYHRVPAKIDAVFAGRLSDEPGHEQAGTYTIVDWKTGSRPRDAGTQEDCLLQLDVYRLVFSLATGVNIDNVDACLFYVSEKDPTLRQIVAQPKTTDEIVAEIVRNPRFAAAMGPDEDVAGEPGGRTPRAASTLPSD